MTTAPTILDLCDDQAVFGSWFKDRATWQAWFSFLAVLFGLPLSPEALAVYQQCTGRQATPSGPFFEAWLICGRRGGKSFVLALVATFLAISRAVALRVVVCFVVVDAVFGILDSPKGLKIGTPML